MTNEVHSNTVAVDLDRECQICSVQVDVMYEYRPLCDQRVHLSGCQGP